MTIQIQQPLNIGYRHRSQVVLAEIVDGSGHLKGLKVVMRCFDPIYYCPADLPAVLLPRILPRSLFAIANDAYTSDSKDITTSAIVHETQTRLPVMSTEGLIHNLPSELQDQVLTESKEPFNFDDYERNLETPTTSTETLLLVSSSKSHIINTIQYSERVGLLACQDTYKVDVHLSNLCSNSQEYPTFNKTEESPERGYMSPAKFSKIMFENEISAYHQLKSLQGKYVPIFQGHYHLVLPDRELNHDKVVYVVLLEYITGTPLSDIRIHSMDHEAANDLWKKVLKATTFMHEAGVVQRLPYLDKMIWRKDSDKKVGDDIVWINFSYSMIISKMDEAKGKSMAHECFRSWILWRML